MMAKREADEATDNFGFPNHETADHSHGEFVCDGVLIHRLESLWMKLKCGFMSGYHHWSRKHTKYYVGEFAGRQNTPHLDSACQMAAVVGGAVGMRLTYRDLAA